jgi:hypothetical protein
MPAYVGIDVHRKHSQVTAVTEDGTVQAGRGGDWLDAVPVLVQQVPDLGESPPHRGAAGAEQVREGIVGQTQPQVEHGGHHALGEREERGAAGAGLVPGVAGGVVTRFVLALGLAQGSELGDQLIRPAGASPVSSGSDGSRCPGWFPAAVRAAVAAARREAGCRV